ncbi:hypothetical protein [Daejeonella sp.]|uniref:hypothetical protein n=1 Tax=Daejeonella sp. TaxID=2805397 RepID=UPI0026A7CB58|nr:hypothetical protein [Daejeonella sp.]HQT24647.1 hypothetical protein [Daejeonella sp.]HQT58636.1 hypothetical protein [Daejeonella sp.]
MTDNKTNRKIFYGNAYLYFILAAVVTIFAFFPSYFNRLTSTDDAHHFHGITATLWLVLLIIQPFLYKTGNLRWHRMIGKISFVLVPLIIISALNMVQIMLINKASYPPNIPDRLAFIDFATLVQFLLFYLLAIYKRKEIQLHARYMVCTVLGPLIPALTRLLFRFPGIDNFNKSLNISYIIIEVVLILLLLDDKRSGKIPLPYVLAIILFIVQHLLMNFVAEWEWWIKLMETFALLKI